MELKVWVEGIQRIVCGVTEATTCQDVVYALAHATGKSGRFTLIERWRNNERLLAPQDNPLKVLLKWGEYSNDVQFILQRSDSKGTSTAPSRSSEILEKPPTRQSPEKIKPPQPAQHRDVQKSFTFTGSYQADTVAKPSGSPKRAADSSPSQRHHPPVPPPYRDPPPPTSAVSYDKLMRKNQEKLPTKLEETVLYNAQYRELVSLVNFQRDKLSLQQADLTKFDAEIVYWEGKEREKHRQLEFLAQELITVGNASKINNEQLQSLSYVEEESELVRQQEKTLKSEITLLRSKLANCETELLQCKNKMRLVMEELQYEQRLQSRRTESRKQFERNFLAEVERLQKDLEVAKQSTEVHHITADTLKTEVAALELAISDKKRQLEHLVQEMKDANLESLSIMAPEELGHTFEGPNRTGSTRKIIGSPRQLENAVPTNKNPQGVWV